MKIYIGIDLGTSNTSANKFWIGKNGEPNLTDIEIMQRSHGTSKRQELLPSILYRKRDGSDVVGLEAKDLKEHDINDANEKVRYLENTKRYIGTKETFTIDDQTYSPIDVATKILSHVKRFSEINSIKGEYNTIITVPANFLNDQRNDTLEAARRAGFSNVELYDEPKAAIISFLHEESEKINDKQLDLSSSKRILVIDIGGGTCDICVDDVVLDEDKYKFTHLAVGRENVGGVDFDKYVGDAIAKKYLKNIELSQKDIANLRDRGQKIKETISDDISYKIYEEYDGDDSKLYSNPEWMDILENYEIEGKNSITINDETINISLTVREFINSITPLVYCTNDEAASNKDERERFKNMESLINNTLKDNDIDIETIDLIFLTGGMAKCFPLKAALYEVFQKKIISPSDPLLAVSKGAALVSKYKSVDVESLDIMPSAIMMEMDDGRLETLVSMGEKVPVKKIVDKTFTTTSRTGVTIKLFEGKNQFDSQLRKINNRYVIDFDEPKKIGREFIIEYSVDRTKRIKFIITFLDSNEKYEISGQIREGK